MLDYETSLWERGYKYICGVDEVGRGAFAGPLVAGAVVFTRKHTIDTDIIIRDSKKMTQLQREKSADYIRNNFTWGVGEASVGEINNLGIMPATCLAFSRAIDALKSTIDFLLLDAFSLPSYQGEQKAIKRGDSVSMSIAAASIVAKVYRDGLMVMYAKNEAYSAYSWDSNKGYGTKAHRRAIAAHGACDLHRSQFIRSSLP